MFNRNEIDINLLIVTILVGIIIANILNLNNSIHILLLICGLYIIVLCFANNKEVFTNVLNKINGSNNNNKFISKLEDYRKNNKINNNSNRDNFSSVNSSYWPKHTKKNTTGWGYFRFPLP